jgi:hypothetical protein
MVQHPNSSPKGFQAGFTIAFAGKKSRQLSNLAHRLTDRWRPLGAIFRFKFASQ